MQRCCVQVKGGDGVYQNDSYQRRGPVQNRRRPGIQIQPRFFIFLLMLAMLIAIVYLVASGKVGGGSARTGTSMVRRAGDYGSQFHGEAVIVRDELLEDAENVSRVDFVANEGATVFKNDVLCYIYAAGYSQKEMDSLELFRDTIKQYHRDRMIRSFSDPELQTLDDAITGFAWEARLLVQGNGEGSLSNVERQLKDALQSRKSYLKRKYPDDQTLDSLYEEEDRRLRKIAGTTLPLTAKRDGIVSFYTDGYENQVNMETFSLLTAAQVHAVLAGQSLETDVVARGRRAVCRSVAPDTWWVLMISRDSNWNPVEGQVYKMLLEGFDGYLLDATVRSATRASGEILVRLEVNSNVLPVLNIRTCGITVGEALQGLVVPVSALREQGEYLGVVLAGGQSVFVPVTVLTNDGKNAYVQPVYPGTLMDGQTVVTY